MKLPHFALAGLFLLLAAGLYLTLQSDMDGRMEEMKADADRRLQQQEKFYKEQLAASAQAAEEAKARLTEAAPKPAGTTDPAVQAALDKVKDQNNTLPTVAATEPPNLDPTAAAAAAEARRIAEDERNLLNTARAANPDTTAAAGAEEPERLTQLQSHIATLSAIAKVKNANPAVNEGFVILDQGSEVGLRPGDRFAVRRGTAIIGRVTIGDTVEAAQCVANVQPSKFVTGMVIKEGDDIIKFEE